MEILFKAKDGKIFYDEWECEKYENFLECQELADSLLWWNSEREPIPVTKNADEVYFVYIKSEEAADFMEEICRDNGWSVYDDFNVGGMYYWNDMAESFYSITEQTDRLNDELAELQKMRYFMWNREVENNGN